MRNHHHYGADAPGLTAPGQPTSDTAHVASAGRVEGNEKGDRFDCRGTPQAGQALRVIEGESKAHAYLARLQAQQAAPDELAMIVSTLSGAALRGFCRVIEKALGGTA